MYARYSRNFQIGRDTHTVELYRKYTKEQGLIGQPMWRSESPRMSECICNSLMTKAQIAALKQLGRDRQDGIITGTGRYYAT